MCEGRKVFGKKKDNGYGFVRKWFKWVDFLCLVGEKRRRTSEGVIKGM